MATKSTESKEEKKERKETKETRPTVRVWIQLDEEATKAYDARSEMWPWRAKTITRYIRSALGKMSFVLESKPFMMPFDEETYPITSGSRCLPPTVRKTTRATSRPQHIQLWFSGEAGTTVDANSIFAAGSGVGEFATFLRKEECKKTLWNPDDPPVPIQLYHDICSLWGPRQADHWLGLPMLDELRIRHLHTHLPPSLAALPAVRDFIDRVLYPYTRDVQQDIYRPCAALLYGPPGTGKTSLARAVLEHAGVRILWSGTAASLNSRYLGDTEKLIKSIFESSQETPNLLCGILFDEIEVLVKKRDAHAGRVGSSETKIDFTSVMLDIVDKRNYPNVVLIGCTNRKSTIEEAFLRPGRMFDHFFFGRLPLQARIEILSKRFPAWATSVLAIMTFNFTGALMERCGQERRRRITTTGFCPWTASDPSIVGQDVQKVCKLASDPDLPSHLADLPTYERIWNAIRLVTQPGGVFAHLTVPSLVTGWIVDYESCTLTTYSKNGAISHKLLSVAPNEPTEIKYEPDPYLDFSLGDFTKQDIENGTAWVPGLKRESGAYTKDDKFPSFEAIEKIQKRNAARKMEFESKRVPGQWSKLDVSSMEAAIACLASVMDLDGMIRLGSHSMKSSEEESVSEMCTETLLAAKEYTNGVLVMVDAEDVLGIVDRSTSTKSREHAVSFDEKKSRHWSESSSHQIDVLRPHVLNRLRTLSRELSSLTKSVLAFRVSNPKLVALVVKAMGWGPRVDGSSWEWSATTLPPTIDSSDGLRLVCTAAEIGVARGNQVWTSGRHYWSVTLTKSETMQVEIGIGSEHVESTTSLSSQLAWFLDASTGYIGSPLSIRRRFCPKLEPGDVVGILLDLDHHGLLYIYVNDILQGLAFTGLKGKLVPVVMLRNPMDSVILCVHREPPVAFPTKPTLPVFSVLDLSRARDVKSSDGLTVVVGAAGWQTLVGTTPFRCYNQHTWGIRFHSTTGLEYVRLGLLASKWSGEHGLDYHMEYFDYHTKCLTNMPIDSVMGWR